jgi:hypothetical protein
VRLTHFLKIPVTILLRSLVGALLTLAFPSTLLAQNLVANPGFECFIDQNCDYIRGDTYSLFPVYACGWSLPNRGTSDIFSTKLPQQCWNSMPTNTYVRVTGSPVVGRQSPKSGDRFAGIYTYTNALNPLLASYREYLQTQLTRTLVVGKSYCAEMYVSLAETPKFGSNNLSMYIHDQRFDPTAWVGGAAPIPNITPQVIEDRIILDSVNWVPVAGLFTATSAAQFLTIGNFSDDSHTAATPRGGYYPTISGFNSAYYFIDDISVEEFRLKDFQLSGVTTICAGDTTQITASSELKDVFWTTLNDSLKVVSYDSVLFDTPEVTTDYVVRGRNCKLIVKETITVIVKPSPVVNLGNDTTLCKGTTRLLDAGNDGTSYKWGNGSTESTLIIDSPGEYSVEVENDLHCIVDDHISIIANDIPEMDLGGDTTICDAPAILFGGNGGRTYLWSTGDTTSTLSTQTAGSYWVRATNECGIDSDTVRIHSFEKLFAPSVVTLNDDRFNEHFAVTPTYDRSVALQGQIFIYDRYGNLVHHDLRYRDTWPRHNLITSAVYYYLFQIPGCPALKGTIHVLK